MKKKSLILLILAILIVAVGCSKDRYGENAAGDWNLEERESDLLEEVAVISEEKKPIDLVNYLGLNMIRMRHEELSEAVYILNEMQKEYLDSYNSLIEDRDLLRPIEDNMEKIEAIDPKDQENLEGAFDFIEDQETRLKIVEAYESFYKISPTTYKFIIDYDRYSKYENNINSELKEYLELMKEEENFILKEDTDLVSIGDKLISIEEHLKKYTRTFGYEELLRIYSEDLRLLMEGEGQLILVDEDENFKPEVLESYRIISEKEGITAEAIGLYMEKIEEAEGRLDDGVRESILTIHNRSIALLEK